MSHKFKLTQCFQHTGGEDSWARDCEPQASFAWIKGDSNTVVTIQKVNILRSESSYRIHVLLQNSNKTVTSDSIKPLFRDSF